MAGTVMFVGRGELGSEPKKGDRGSVLSSESDTGEVVKISSASKTFWGSSKGFNVRAAGRSECAADDVVCQCATEFGHKIGVPMESSFVTSPSLQSSLGWLSHR